jgi:histone deacetylase 11
MAIIGRTRRLAKQIVMFVFSASLLQSGLAAGQVVDSNNVGQTAFQPKAAVVYSKNYLINLMGFERLHPFDIKKYQKIYDQLKRDGLLDENKTHQPQEVLESELLLIHQQEYLNKLKVKRNVAAYLEADVLNRLPVSLDRGILRPFRYASGGTILAGRKALKYGIGINIGGGYHHAKPHKGEGFCIYADVPIAIRVLQKEEKIKRALIIDVDAHQGNGTIACLPDDDSTYTFSMHGGSIYPIPKEIGDWDIELNAGTRDEMFLEKLGDALPKLFDRAKPDIVFIIGGCDTLENDPLGAMSMTEEGLAKRDMMIVDHCVAEKVPVVLTLAGGYSDNAWHAQYMSLKGILHKYPAVNNEAAPAKFRKILK